jgi:hypothetical protein
MVLWVLDFTSNEGESSVDFMRSIDPRGATTN